MNFLSNDSIKIEENEIYKKSNRIENCLKQRYLLAKLSLELKYRMLEILNFGKLPELPCRSISSCQDFDIW